MYVTHIIFGVTLFRFINKMLIIEWGFGGLSGLGTDYEPNIPGLTSAGPLMHLSLLIRA